MAREVHQQQSIAVSEDRNLRGEDASVLARTVHQREPGRARAPHLDALKGAGLRQRENLGRRKKESVSLSSSARHRPGVLLVANVPMKRR